MVIPFKPLLRPKAPFSWTEELDDASTCPKEEIIKVIEQGVRIFNPKCKTCLNPDWSITGVGCWLCHKYYSCKSSTPNCCPSGWKITFAYLRFLQLNEQRYAPTEGEALAVAWELEDSKFFTLDCNDIVIATDHKPLAKIFDDPSLDEITNTRIFCLKQ